VRSEKGDAPTMRRNTRDELLRGFLAINALLREELGGLRRALKKRSATEAKYNPNWSKQPRAPRGVPEGGQWVDGGGADRPKQQIQRTQPRTVPEPQPERPSLQRVPIATNDNTQSAADDNQLMRLAISAFRLSPPLLALPLSGDTPQPRIETRRITDDLFLVTTETPGRRFSHFQRVFRPERRVPWVVLGVDTGLTITEPAVTEALDVDVVVDGDHMFFDPAALRAAYGRDIAAVPQRPPLSFEVAPTTPEERLLQFNLEQVGASREQISLALQQFRDREAEGDAFVAQLRAWGASRDRARAILRTVRQARSNRPYRAPTSGPWVEIFPDLPTAPGKTRIFAVDAVRSNLGIAANELSARRAADALISDIRSIDPRYISPNLNDTELFPQTAEGRAAYLDRLQAERAAVRFMVRDEVEPLQVETLRFLQQRADELYPLLKAQYDAGELDGLSRENAIGTALDETLRAELRRFYISLGLRENDLIRVNRREYISRRDFRRPDARVANVFFDITIEDKSLEGKQIIGFFASEARPTYTIIIRPRRVGRTFLVTPPRSRYAKD
jgi:hypothetical protein